jgi:aminoglycoside phosphotransferase (APT) family kinase protein
MEDGGRGTRHPSCTRRGMSRATVQELVQRLADEDPLGLGRLRWRATRLESRRFSSIHTLHPVDDDGRLRRATGGDVLILKLYRVAHPERRQREFDDQMRVYRAMGPGAGVVRPVICWADRGAIVTVGVQGESFARVVRAACRRGASRRTLAHAAALCTKAGAWLRSFQERGREAVRRERPPHLVDPRTFLEYVDERLRLLRARRPPVEADLHTRLLAHAAASLHALPAGTWNDVTWSHSDFGPHNLLVDGEALHVLDFELAPQHPYFDLAYFTESLAHVGGPGVEPTRVQRLERAFLAGHGPEVDLQLLALFRLRHAACTYVSESRRRGIAQVRALPGLLALRERLRRLPRELAPRFGSRVA